jgi:hypothetical protein
MEASPPTGPDVNNISAKDVDLRRTHTRAERVNARAVEMGHADVEELAADEAHIRGPLQPRRFELRITAECLDTRDIAAENVVVEHITGTRSRQLRRRPSSPPQTVPSWSWTRKMFTHRAQPVSLC